MKKVNILFVCRYNRLRSRVAAAYFNKINKNKNFKAKSAGLIKGQPLNSKTVSIVKKLGLDISGKTSGLTSKLMKWQNITVAVADSVPREVFDKNKKYGKEVIAWNIKDPKVYDLEGIRKVVNRIKKKVVMLNKKIKKLN